MIGMIDSSFSGCYVEIIYRQMRYYLYLHSVDYRQRAIKILRLD